MNSVTRSNTEYIVKGCFISLPEKTETWYEAGSFPSLSEAKAMIRPVSKGIVTTAAYQKYKILKRQTTIIEDELEALI